MKRLIAVGLVLNAVLMAVVIAHLSKDRTEAAHAAGRGGGVPVGNGDVNGDGRIDLSDAVYTLSWLFFAGPEPKAIECPPSPPAGALPDTGQTKCYNAAGNEVSCESATCPRQDGAYATGCPSEGRFVDNGDGTVTDHCTGLLWQKDTADVNGDGRSTDQDFVNWCQALAYCKNLSFAGHDDWRMPNVRELQSIVAYERSDPGIDPVFGASSSNYWTSTSDSGSHVGALFVYFGGGGVTGGFNKVVTMAVRGVRSGP